MTKAIELNSWTAHRIRHVTKTAITLLALAAGCIANAASEMGVAQIGNSVKFAVPPNWQIAKQDDQAVIIAPEAMPKGGCILAVTRAYEDDQHDDVALAMQVANAFLPPELRPFGTGGISRLDGVTAKGWHFIDLYGGAGNPRLGMAAHVLIAQLGSKRAAMVGVSSASIETNPYAMAPEPKPTCLAGQNNRLWVTIFHSLMYDGIAMDPTEFRKLLVGNWSHSGDKVSFAMSFLPNGDFSYGASSGYILHNVKPGYDQLNTTSLGQGGHWETPGGDQLIRHCKQGCDVDMRDLVSLVRKVDPANPSASNWTLRMVGVPPHGDFTMDWSRDR